MWMLITGMVIGSVATFIGCGLLFGKSRELDCLNCQALLDANNRCDFYRDKSEHLEMQCNGLKMSNGKMAAMLGRRPYLVKQEA